MPGSYMWSVTKIGHFLDFDSLARNEWSASDPSRYTVAIRPRYHILVSRSLGEPQSECEQCSEENIIDPTETRTRTLGRPPCRSSFDGQRSSGACSKGTKR
jgi:hypothetical protein